MKKLIRKTFALLITAVLALLVWTGCKFSSEVPDGNNNDGLAYLVVTNFSGEKLSRAVATPDSETITGIEITKLEVVKVVLKADKEGIEEKYRTVGTWISDEDATEETGNAICKMQADKTISIPEGTYTFTLELYDEQGNVSGSGIIENKTVVAGFNDLKFDVQMAEEGTGSVKIKNTFSVSDKISRIEAGLFDVFSQNELVTYKDEEHKVIDKNFGLRDLEIVTEADGVHQHAVFADSKITAGTYLYKVVVYSKTPDDEELQINAYTDAVEITTGLTTIETRPLYAVNKILKINYVLNEGQWFENYNPPKVRNVDTTVILPTSAGVYRKNYSFLGWYSSNAEDAQRIEVIEAGNGNDVSVYAKWLPNNLTYAVTLHKSKADEVEISGRMLNGNVFAMVASAGYDDYKWFLDSKLLPEYNGRAEVELATGFFDGGNHDITVHVTKDGKNYTTQVVLEITRLPDFPITYKNAVTGDFESTEFTGVHEERYAPVFYYSGTTILDAPSMVYYDFAGYFLSEDASGTEYSVISGTEFEDEITLYAKWVAKNAVQFVLPQNSISKFQNVNLMNRDSSLYVLGEFEGENKWYPYEFFKLSEDEKSGELRSNKHRTGTVQNYYSMFPYSAIKNAVESNITSTEIALSYENQKQTGNNNQDNVKLYDYSAAKISAASNSDVEAKMEYKALGEIFTFTLSGAPAKKFEKLVLYVPDVYIPSKGKVNLAAEKAAFVPDITGKTSDNYNHFEMALDISAGVGENLVIYTALPPFNASGKALILTLIDEDNNYYNAYFDGQNYESGNIYDCQGELNALPHFVAICGKKVATHNVNAYSPEDYGTLHVYSDELSSEFASVFGDHAKLPVYDDWATIAENEEASFVVITRHGVNGLKITHEETELFIPFNGYCSYNGTGIYRNNEANLWTATKYGSTTMGYSLYANSDSGNEGVMAYSDVNTYRYGVRPFASQ